MRPQKKRNLVPVNVDKTTEKRGRLAINVGNGLTNIFSHILIAKSFEV